jgi:hypothetical protein
MGGFMENEQSVTVANSPTRGIEIITKSTAKRIFLYDMVRVKLVFASDKDDDDKSHALKTVTRRIIRFNKEVYRKITKTADRAYLPSGTVDTVGDTINRSFQISFVYGDENTLANFIELTEKLKEDKPLYEISFGFADVDRKYSEVLKDAAISAKNRAESIARGVGAHIERCLKVEYDERVDMQYMEGELASNPLLADNYEVPASIEGELEKSEKKQESKMSEAIIEHIRETFVPEAVEISATVKCIWLAE